MGWEFVAALVALTVALALLAMKKYTGGGHLLGRVSIKKRVIQFATPHRMELIALSLFFFTFFIADLAQNKFLDLGMDYSVIVLWNITMPALYVWQVFLILFHVCLVWLFVMSLNSKATNGVYDLIVGAIALFGVAVLLAGVIAQIYSETINFLWMTFRSIDFYHLGVYAEMLAGIYWAFTK